MQQNKPFFDLFFLGQNEIWKKQWHDDEEEKWQFEDKNVFNFFCDWSHYGSILEHEIQFAFFSSSSFLSLRNIDLSERLVWDDSTGFLHGDSIESTIWKNLIRLTGSVDDV